MKVLIIIFNIISFSSFNLFAQDNLENKFLICKADTEKKEVWGFKFLDIENLEIHQIIEHITDGELYVGTMYYEAKAETIYIGMTKGNASFGHLFTIDRKTLILTDTRELQGIGEAECFIPENKFDEELRSTYEKIISDAKKGNKI